jgi:hypothetical protein
MQAWRYKYRVLGEPDWRILNCGRGSEYVAKAIVADWNKRDRGKREWDYDECLPEDSDYPEKTERCLL